MKKKNRSPEKKIAGGKIIRIAPESIAEEIGLSCGDEILEINGTALKDIIDVSFAFSEEDISLTFRRGDEVETVEFSKDYDEDLGVEFETAVFDGIRRCANRCLFCFVDQVPPALRSSLYVKDDDYRLSFLYGNFITLTNMKEADRKRIAQYHLSPLFVSVHAMNLDLRAKLLGTPKAKELIKELDRFADDGISYHAQAVICPDLNDGQELLRTIDELWARRPSALTLGVVPVGLTRYRTECYPLAAFDKTGAAKIIDLVEKKQEEFLSKEREKAKNAAVLNVNGENASEKNLVGEEFPRFVYLADEFYILAGRKLPKSEAYDGFPQLDNGIGLVRSFLDDWKRALAADMADAIGEKEKISRKNELSLKKQYAAQEKKRLTIVCGTAIAPFIKDLAAEMENIRANLSLAVVPIENAFFGQTVNVSGLLTGQDIRCALAARKKEDPSSLGDGVIIPASCLRQGENVFLDDVSLTDLSRELNVPIVPVLHGDKFYQALNDWDAVKKSAAEMMSDTRTAYMWQKNAAYTDLSGEW